MLLHRSNQSISLFLIITRTGRIYFQAWSSAHMISLTDIDDPDALVLQELKSDGYVLQLLGTEGGPLVVFW